MSASFGQPDRDADPRTYYVEEFGFSGFEAALWAHTARISPCAVLAEFKTNKLAFRQSECFALLCFACLVFPAATAAAARDNLAEASMVC